MPSIVDPARTAVIDEAHCRKVNRELFFVADAGELAKFDRSPLDYVGILTDPVSGERFRPGDAPGEATWDGRLWYFSTDETLGTFLADPAKYAAQEVAMLPETAAPAAADADAAPAAGAPPAPAAPPGPEVEPKG